MKLFNKLKHLTRHLKLKQADEVKLDLLVAYLDVAEFEYENCLYSVFNNGLITKEAMPTE